jgi:hypothetical protein
MLRFLNLLAVLNNIFTRLCQKAPPFMAGMNGEASLAEVPQSGTKAGLKEGFGEVSPFIFGKPRDLSRGGFTHKAPFLIKRVATS